MTPPAAERGDRERFHRAFHAAGVTNLLVGFDGRLLDANAATAAALGYTVPELLGRPVTAIIHPRDVERDLADLAGLERGEREWLECEKRYVRKDGSFIWTHVVVSLIRDADGDPAHVAVHGFDRTRRAANRELFEAIFEHSCVAAVVVDDDRRIVDLNDAFCGLTGLARAEALTLRVDDLLPHADVDARWPVLLSHGTLARATTFTRPNGDVRQIELEATAHVALGRHLAIIRDVTERAELERQLQDAKRLEAVGRLAGGVAHDFNNLLTTITGYSELLARDVTDERHVRHAREIEKAAARAAELTQQLLAFGRRQTLQPVRLDLNDVVADLEPALKILLEPEIELYVRLELGLGPVVVDRARIERVLLDLAEHSHGTMPAGGRLTVSTHSAERDGVACVEVRLTDTGEGLTDEARRSMFDPFAANREVGLSLGLATVLGVVEQSGGTIAVESAPGSGTAYRVLLPRAGEPGSAEG